MIVRPESLEDAAERAAIYEINRAAFGRPDEAQLVEALRAAGAVLLSLLAEADSQNVGHILFTRVWIDSAKAPVPAVALAPVAVLPERQRHGIGASLIRGGLDLLRERGERIVLVLGYPRYYQRFGFSVAQARALQTPFPPEAFMALELTSGALDGVRGPVRYPSPFGV